MALSIMWCLSSIAQQFVDVSNEMQLYVQVGNALLGAGMSSYDIDSNGFEDLTFATFGNGIFIYLNNDGVFDPPIVIADDGDVKAVIWADYDNDGDADLFVTHDGSVNKLYAHDGNLNFYDVTISSGIQDAGIGRSHGAAWSDINRDGFLDLYVCNYDWDEGAPNWLFLNQGDGTFSEVAEAYGVDNGVLPSFMPSFSDFNKDQNPDLYVINDKTALNALFISNAQGQFNDISASSGTDILADAMSNSITDFDRDGDMDIYISNNYTGNKLLRNDGDNQFTEIAEDLGVELNLFSWGALWVDYNNSGYPDLFISTETPLNVNANPIFENTGGQDFTPINAFMPSNTSPSFSNSHLDYNGDGALDIAQSNDGTNGVYLWENLADVGNWVRIKLEGTVSNKDGVGSWIEVYTSDQTLSDFTKCGEGYMSQRSQYHHFGLNESIAIDSVIVKWPSGLIDSFYDLSILDTHVLLEGSSFELSLAPEQTMWFCENDSLFLSPGDFETYSWSNGAETSSIWVSEPTSVWVSVTTEEGLSLSSPVYSVNQAPEFTFEYIVDQPSCFGYNDGSIEVFSDMIEEISWEGEYAGTVLNNLIAGDYSMSIEDTYGCSFQTLFMLLEPEILEVVLDPSDVLCFGETSGFIEMTSQGGTGEHLVDGELENLAQGEYTITVTDELGCSTTESAFIDQPLELEATFNVTHVIEGELGEIETTVLGGTPPYDFYWSNSSEDQNPEDLEPGPIQCNIIDANGCQFSEVIIIDEVVGVDELAQTMEVYPNPTSGILQITGIQSANVQVEIFSIVGKSVYSSLLTSTTLDLSHLAPGRYIIHLQDDHHFVSYNLIIR